MKTKRPRFLADAMLGNIARKLRFFGFDTLYMVHSPDDEVLKAGVRDDRIILTADRELFKRVIKTSAEGVLVDGETELDNLVHILSKARVHRVDLDGATLCPKCGATLTQRSPAEFGRTLPNDISSRFDGFFQCAGCGKVYWEGGHYSRMRLFAAQINGRLAALQSQRSVEMFSSQDVVE